MTDFFREVDEEYRRDRVVKTLTRYQVPLVILVILIIAGTAGYKFWAGRQLAAAEQVNTRYMAAQDLARDGNTQRAMADFVSLSQDGPAGYATLARLQTAGLIGAGNGEAGAKAYDAIANDDKVPEAMRDAARLRGAVLRIDIDDPKAFESRYGRFTQPSFAYHASMRELMALAAMKRGDYAAAGRFLDEIIIDARAPEGVRFRAQAFRELVNGGAVTSMSTQPPSPAVTPIGQAASATPATAASGGSTTPASKPAAPEAKPAAPEPKPAPPASKPAPPLTTPPH